MKTLSQGVPGLDVAYTKLREFSMDDELREIAMARQKAIRDKEAEINYALNKGIEKGHAQGHAEGLEKGLEKGRAEGRAEASRSKLLQFLEARFPQYFTADLKAAICNITDERHLDVLFTEALMTSDIQDVVKLL